MLLFSHLAYYLHLLYPGKLSMPKSVASEPAEKWGGIVRRAKGRGLGRGCAPLQLGVWGLAPRKKFVKK